MREREGGEREGQRGLILPLQQPKWREREREREREGERGRERRRDSMS